MFEDIVTISMEDVGIGPTNEDNDEGNGGMDQVD